uniref:Uncharacterized protein n=1 Tax=Molossus molossus TaxID=27622 RepID=A0A7J8BJA3_MOLMO|nr:hypothetical protein HJG59_010207 [Molossus molossus]
MGVPFLPPPQSLHGPLQHKLTSTGPPGRTPCPIHPLASAESPPHRRPCGGRQVCRVVAVAPLPPHLGLASSPSPHPRHSASLSSSVPPSARGQLKPPLRLSEKRGLSSPSAPRITDGEQGPVPPQLPVRAPPRWASVNPISKPKTGGGGDSNPGCASATTEQLRETRSQA